MNRRPCLSILGGGPAGLSVGWYARARNLPFTVYEAAPRIGGNCVTLTHGDFRFDSGAHRFHDKDSGITADLQSLLGPELVETTVPSQIYWQGKYIDFPLSVSNLLGSLGASLILRNLSSLLAARFGGGEFDGSFEQFALRAYGRVVAERFLLNYSEKLWGTPASTISHQITGQRLKTLTLRTILMEALGAPSPRPRHYEGAFYYPRSGFGAITDALAESCGYDHIRLNARITRLRHDGSRVQAIELNGNELVPADEVVSTLPLNRLAGAMDPPLDPEILGLAESLRFRSLILVALFANKESITPNATVYFPESRFPFSRVTEPRNRSRPMSPPHATSLVAEVACWEGDEMWRASDSALAGMVARNLIEIGWIQERDVVDSAVVRMHHAYPVLELGLQEKVEKIQDCLKCFENLTVLGRSGLFQYTSLHHMMRFGKDTVERYVGGQ